MKTAVRTLLALLPLLCTPFALAQHQTFSINPDSSSVAFLLPSNHDATNGTFHVEKGVVNFDASSPNLSGLIVVSASSGNTGNSTRDKRMLNEVLQATKFADITFAPQTYAGTLSPTGDSTIQVTGIFTLHGAPHTITVPMQLHIDGVKCTAKTTFKVPYVEWGLKDPSWLVFRVAKEAEVTLNLAGFLAPAK